MIILLIGITIGRMISRIIKRVLHEFEIDSTIRKTKKIKISFEKMLSNFVGDIIYIITVIIVLGELGVTTTALNIITASLVLIIVIIFFFILNYNPKISISIFVSYTDKQIE